mgnify:CR=1 FL=1
MSFGDITYTATSFEVGEPTRSDDIVYDYDLSLSPTPWGSIRNLLKQVPERDPARRIRPAWGAYSKALMQINRIAIDLNRRRLP